jgi:hypothetical protein
MMEVLYSTRVSLQAKKSTKLNLWVKCMFECDSGGLLVSEMLLLRLFPLAVCNAQLHPLLCTASSYVCYTSDCMVSLFPDFANLFHVNLARTSLSFCSSSSSSQAAAPQPAAAASSATAAAPAAAAAAPAAAAAAPAAAEGPAAVLDRQIKALSKKVRQCQALSSRQAAGEALSQQEQEKLGKMPGW